MFAVSMSLKLPFNCNTSFGKNKTKIEKINYIVIIFSQVLSVARYKTSKIIAWYETIIKLYASCGKKNALQVYLGFEQSPEAA